jgi:dolichol-phosphate mannosyltransferase
LVSAILIMSDKLVIIPTYNELENIEKIIHAVLNQKGDYHILVIDDGSPDGTAQKVLGMIQTDPLCAGRLFIEQRTGKLGLGTAYIHGFRWALAKSQYEYIFEMDADFSHPPDKLNALYEQCSRQGVGVAIGSRYVPGGALVDWAFKRRLMSRGASFYVQWVTFMPVKDPTAGFVCYKRAFLENLNFEVIGFVGYAFQIEMKFAAWQQGWELVEVPITFTDRTAGVSKMSMSIFREAIFGVLKIRWKGWQGVYKIQTTK